MVGDIKWAFEDSLKDVSWMDTETKKAAKEKVGQRCCVFSFPPGKFPCFRETLTSLSVCVCVCVCVKS